MRKMKLQWLQITALVVFGYVISVIGGTTVNTVGPFTFYSGTETNMQFMIQTSINPTINGVALAAGDVVAAYTPAGICVGAQRFDGVSTIPLTAYGKNVSYGDTSVPGAKGTDTISFRVYDSSTALTGKVTVTVASGSLLYTSNLITGLASFVGIVAPNAPILSAPANAAVGVSVTPTLTWGTVAAATTYRVQVSTGSAFGTNVVDDSTLTAASKTVTTALANNTVYYCRVNAKNSVGTGSWSATSSFTTILAAPALTSPVNAATNLSVAPTLTWGTVASAATYRVQVSTISTFASTVADDSTLIAGTKALTGLSNSITYYWRANAKNAAGTSVWSSVYNFTTIMAIPAAPALSSPATAATGVALLPTVTWGTVTGAATYRVQVSTISTFASTVVDDSTVTTGTQTLTASLSAGTTYYWHVNAKNVAGTSAYSTMFSFTTTLAAPVLATPATASTGIALAPTLTWGTVTGAATYRVQVSTISTFASTVVDDATLTVGSKAVTGLANSTVYYWRATATGTAGTSAWSTAFNFTTIVTTPAVPTLTVPANAATGTSVTPTLTWGTVTGAATYRVQLSTVSTFASTVIDDSTLTAGSKAITTALTVNKAYYWRVNAKNAGGTSAWSSIFSFTTVPTGIIAATPHYVPANMGNNGMLEIYTANGSRVMELAYGVSATKAQLLNTASKTLAKGYYTYRFHSTDANVEIVGKLIK